MYCKKHPERGVFCCVYMLYNEGMNSIIKRIILVSVFLLPFMIFTRGFYGAIFAKYVFIILTTLLVSSLFLIGRLYNKNNKENHIPKNIVFLIFGSYVALLIVSCFNGVLPQLSFWSSFDQGTGVVFMLCLFALSIITSSVFKKVEDWYKLFAVFTASGIVFTLGSWLAVAGVHFSKYLNISMQSGFTIGNSSWTGIYMAFVFFISLGLAFSSKAKSQKIIGIIGLATSFFDPTLTGFLIQFPGMHFGPIGLAQTASYAIMVGIALFGLYLLYRKIKSVKWRKVFIGSFLSVVLVGIISFTFIGLAPIKNLIAEKAGPNRLVFWNIAVEGFKEKPLLGWGGDTYQYVYGKYFDPIIFTPGYAPEYWVDKAHSYYFDELVTGGVVGFTLLMLLYGVILFGLIRKAITNTQNKEGLLYMALFTGVVAFLIQGLMLFQTITGWFIIAILISFVAGTCFKDRSKINTDVILNKNKNKNKNIDTNKGFNMFISVIITIIFCILFNYLIAKPYTINRGLSEFPRMPYTQRLEFFKKLDASYIGNTVDIGNAFSPYHVRLRNILKKGLKEDEKKLMINEIKAINNVLENASSREHDMDVKLLMTNVGFYSILAGIAPDEDRKTYYDKGIANINKITQVSDKNPIIILSKSIMDVSFKYGKEGVDAFDTNKKKD